LEIDERKLMGVVATGRRERMPIVRQRNDIEWQISQRNVPARRLERPAVWQEKSLLSRPGVPRRFLGPGRRGERQVDSRPEGHGGQMASIGTHERNVSAKSRSRYCVPREPVFDLKR